MEMFFSAILSDLTSRSVSFLIDKCSRPTAAPSVEETLDSLQRLLLRVGVVVEEAEERLIANQAMLRQLNRLRTEMYRGYHTLDTFRCQAQWDKAKDHQVSPSPTPSRFNPAKRVCFCNGSSSSEQEKLNEVIGCLELTIRDASELVVFLTGCPRLYRQPYSMYLLLEKSMFGRQMEMEQIMDFLLEAEAPIDGNPGVLPIIGPGKVGKSTLIEHACNDERVRNHFSQILRFSEDSITDKMTAVTLCDCGVIKHNNRDIGSERILVIIELTGDIDEGVWRKLHSDCKHYTAIGSKIIVASRSDKIARLGTTQDLRVQFFSKEAYWYFFKVRTFGSTDTEDHPKLASLAMDMAREMNGCFFGASAFSVLLKANFNAHFWSVALASIKEFKRTNLLLFGAHFADPWQIVDPIYVRRVNKTSSEYFVILDDYQTGSVQNSAQSEAPNMSIRDLLFGRVRPHGRFKVLAWRSHIPPHYSYMLHCEMRRPQRTVSRKKRIQETTS
ncbi:putative disease resistance protein RGA3 [Phragmites australis]|uniref:putative disease resistance protein RGA3 n=1 Tax=Phragmites australis TaxID=29695 RepID=UPI002D76FE3C|nr:putative disease resistance protein RGA3 [Phragmites australis]